MTESVLSVLHLKPEDKLIAIKEQNLADATFVLSSIMSHCFSNQNNVCLVTLHNTIGHYHNIGKRLGYDLLNQIKEGHAKTIEPLKEIAEEILSENKKYLSEDKGEVVKLLFLEIKKVTEELLQNNRQTTIIIDDASHLLDIGMGYNNLATFLKYCIGLTTKNNISAVINYHSISYGDFLMSNILSHSADLSIRISALKTGRSRKVSGVFSIYRQGDKNCNFMSRVYHYKLFDKEIRIFAPGRALI